MAVLVTYKDLAERYKTHKKAIQGAHVKKISYRRKTFDISIFGKDYAKEERADFSQSYFENCTFLEIVIKDIDFSNSIFRKCKFIRCKFDNCKFDNCLITECEMIYLKMDNCIGNAVYFKENQAPHSQFSNCCFTNSYFDYTDFSTSTFLYGCKILNSSFQHTILIHANFQKCDLRGTFLDFSCLPLWCGGTNMIVDTRLISQIALHIASFEVDLSDCIDEREKKLMERFLEYAKEIGAYSHRSPSVKSSKGVYFGNEIRHNFTRSNIEWKEMV